jgi:hypothetical protein
MELPHGELFDKESNALQFETIFYLSDLGSKILTEVSD